MKDFLGNELSAGDEVLYLKGNYGSSGLNGHSFCIKKIKRFTPKMIVFEDEKKTHPHRVVLNQQEVIERLEHYIQELGVLIEELDATIEEFKKRGC